MRHAVGADLDLAFGVGLGERGHADLQVGQQRLDVLVGGGRQVIIALEYTLAELDAPWEKQSRRSGSMSAC